MLKKSHYSITLSLKSMSNLVDENSTLDHQEFFNSKFLLTEATVHRNYSP